MFDSRQLLLDLIRAQGVPYGREDSIKMSQGRLLSKRLLLGAHTRDLSMAAVLQIASVIRMPEHFRSLFSKHYADANVVLFGVEENERGAMYKLYLEFWEKIRTRVIRTGSKEPALLNLGLKWLETDNSVNFVSRYTCFPMLDLAGILSRMNAVYESIGESPSASITHGIVTLAAKYNPAMIYSEVSERETPRQSFDINLYKASLTMGAIASILQKAAACYALPAGEVEALYARRHESLLGHLSGGVARDGRDFLTVYYEIEPL